MSECQKLKYTTSVCVCVREREREWKKGGGGEGGGRETDRQTNKQEFIFLTVL